MPLDKRQQLELLYFMVLTRSLEDRLDNLFKQGKIVGGLFRSLGQEATAVGTAFALEKKHGDILSPLLVGSRRLLRLRAIAGSGRLAYELLIAPWPPFALFLIAAGAVGGATPLLQIKVISGLINALTPRAGGVPGVRSGPLSQILSPYLPWLFLLLALRIVDWIISIIALAFCTVLMAESAGLRMSRSVTKSPMG